MIRTLFCSLMIALLAAPLAQAFSRDVVVEIYHNTVRPRHVLVAKGDTVIFSYRDKTPGGVLVLFGGSVQSPPMQQYQSWERTFYEAGRYNFYMLDRPSLRGSLTVR